ncbi:MAG: hypothetical protein ACJA2U_001344 [Marinomonas primoryensis]|jgi:hypothetical protein
MSAIFPFSSLIPNDKLGAVESTGLWSNPAFIKASPWFGSKIYWISHLNERKNGELEWSFLSR